MQASFLPSGPSSKPTAPEGFEFVGGRPCGRMYFSPVGGRPCGRMCFSLVGGRPCGRMCLSPVGGCPCGRMIAVAPANIREQGLAPTWTLLLQEFFGRLLFREFSGRPPLRPNVLLPCGRPPLRPNVLLPCGRLPLRPNDCSGSSQYSRAGARSHMDLGLRHTFASRGSLPLGFRATPAFARRGCLPRGFTNYNYSWSGKARF